jgi:hypothetical protein
LASPGGVLQSEDFVRYHVLNQEYLWNAVRSGRLPLWNPHVAFGRPFLADPETAFFYPPYWLHLLVDPRAATAVLLAAHTALGLWATATLARALHVGAGLASWLGVMFLASGTVVQLVASGQILYYAGVCYLPVALLLSVRLQDDFSKRRVGALAGAIALQLLAGHPQVSWMTCLACILFVVGRGLVRPLAASARRLLRVVLGQAGAMALAAAVAAVQILPFLELVGQGNRQARTVDFASSWALPGWAVNSLAFPIPVTNWSDNLYAGSVALLAGLTGLSNVRERNARGLLLVVLVAGTIAVGTSTPGFLVAYHLLPGLSFFRVPGRLGLLLVLALVLSSGVALSRVETNRRSQIVLALTGVIAVASALIVQLGRDALPSVVRALGLLVAAVLLLAWLHAGATSAAPGQPRQRRFRIVVGGALALLTLAEIGHGAWVAKSVVTSRAEFPAEPAIHDALSAAGLFGPEGTPPRVSIPFPLARENAGMHYGWSTFTGYVGLWLDRVWAYVHIAAGLEPPATMVAFPASNIYQGPFPYDSAALVVGVDPTTRKAAFRPAPDPRAYVAPAAVVVPDARQAMMAMRRGHDHRRTALIEEPLEGISASAAGAAGTAHILRFEPERVELEATTERPGLLVLAESYYPGWSATVNERQAPCVPVNGWMRGVPIPSGTSRIVLSFRSTFLGVGALVSGLGLALLVLLALGRRRASL